VKFGCAGVNVSAPGSVLFLQSSFFTTLLLVPPPSLRLNEVLARTLFSVEKVTVSFHEAPSDQILGPVRYFPPSDHLFPSRGVRIFFPKVISNSLRIAALPNVLLVHNGKGNFAERQSQANHGAIQVDPLVLRFHFCMPNAPLL